MLKLGIINRFKLAVDDQEEPVSMLGRLAKQAITLVKPDGSEHEAKASVQPGKIFVFDVKFPVVAGDQIRHVLPSGVEERFQVIDPGFVGGPDPRVSHYEIRVRNVVTPQGASSAAVVHHHYNNHGVANVIGPDGVASGNTNNVTTTHQTLNMSDPRIDDELAQIRRALAAEALDDDDAAIEAGNVASAQRALKANKENVFRVAMKQLGAKALATAEKLALAWITTEGRHLLGLPPS
jgi:hypothetical protein